MVTEGGKVTAKLRRPIEPAELPFLNALGDRLKELRTTAGLSQEQLAYRVPLSPQGFTNIEKARRRTRESTLARIVDALLREAPQVGPKERLLAELVSLAGPALAPESPYRDRIERRRSRRQRRMAQLAEELAASPRDAYWMTEPRRGAP